MAKFKVLDGIFDDKGKGEVVELEQATGDYYVAEGLLVELKYEQKPALKRSTAKK